MKEEAKKENEEDNYEEDYSDDYLTQLHRHLVEMKSLRKKAEQDALLLEGRVRCLKGEEGKTLKKIEVTRKKTYDKVTSIQETQNKLKKKIDFKDQKDKELFELKERNKKMIEEKRLEAAIRREEKDKDLMEEVKALKEQRRANEELIKYNKLEDQSHAKTKADYIKSQQQIAEEKRRAYDLEKKFLIKTEMEKKIMEELERKEEAEKKKVLLEEEEIEIMKRITTTTRTHQMMVEKLEKLSSSNQQT